MLRAHTYGDALGRHTAEICRTLRYDQSRGFWRQDLTAIIWQQDWNTLHGMRLNSPFSGQILPVQSHPDITYRQNIIPIALCCRLSHGGLYSPFNATFSQSLQLGRRLRLTHQSGLSLMLELPLALQHGCGKGLAWQQQNGQHVRAGSLLLQLDLPYLHQLCEEIYCLAVLTLPASQARVYSRQMHVKANQDPLFILQLNK